MPLDRNTVDATAAKHIRDLQKLRPVSDTERREIRKLHERAAAKVDARHR